jgi:hypothetical protein
MRFYLGTHQVGWLASVPASLFVSRRRLATRKRLPRALRPWALDSGGFSELSIAGTWTLSAREYVGEVRRYRDEIGRLEWAAIQDWMCEPMMLRKTGLSIAEHQARTLTNYEELLQLAPELPWVPVLQGWSLRDYFSHLEQYVQRGHDLRQTPLVGVGTMCRRQSTREAMEILSGLAQQGLRLHGFGMKTGALHQGATEFLTSADSLAWSLRARFAHPLPGCTHQRCSSCPRFALRWLQHIEHEMHRSATKVGMRRAHRLGLDLGRPRCDLPPLSRVRKLFKRGASIAEIAATLSCSSWAARQAVAHVKMGQ